MGHLQGRPGGRALCPGPTRSGRASWGHQQDSTADSSRGACAANHARRSVFSAWWPLVRGGLWRPQQAAAGAGAQGTAAALRSARQLLSHPPAPGSHPADPWSLVSSTHSEAPQNRLRSPHSPGLEPRLEGGHAVGLAAATAPRPANLLDAVRQLKGVPGLPRRRAQQRP